MDFAERKEPSGFCESGFCSVISAKWILLKNFRRVDFEQFMRIKRNLLTEILVLNTNVAIIQ